MEGKVQFTWDDFWKGKWPNLATFTGMIMLCVVFPVLNYYGYLTLSLIAYVIGWALDGIDGWLARYLKAESTFGAFFDQGADKINTFVDNVVFLFILMVIIELSGMDLGVRDVFLVIFMFITLGAITLLSIRIYMIRNSHRLKQGKSIGAVNPGKIKTNIERGAGCLFILTQLYIRHVGADEISKATIYFAIFALAVSVYFAGWSIYKQVEKIQ